MAASERGKAPRILALHKPKGVVATRRDERGRATEEHLEAIRRGIRSRAGLLTATGVEGLGGAGPKSRPRVTLDEGKSRRIRRLFGELRGPKFGTPLKVVELRRTHIGSLALDMPSGSWRFLTEEETEELTRALV